MYRFNVNPIKRRHRRFLVAALLLLILIAGGIWLKRNLRTTTTISSPPPAIIHTAKANTPVIKQFDGGIFTIDLPADWKLQNHQTQPTGTNIYTWENTAGNAGVRNLSVYVDSTPTTLGINHALQVQANGSGVSVQGDVSDNCAGFTSPTSGVPDMSSPAKWQGQPFLCNLGDTMADMVGTVSADGINKLYVSGQTTGKHAIFFAYSDDSINPDYSTFINALETFHLK